jgi:hypothetical protein
VTDHGLGALPSPPDDRDFPIEQLYALTGQEKAIVIPAVYYAPNETYAPLNQGTTPQCVAYSSGAMKLCQDGMWPLDAGTFFKRIGGGPNGAITRNAFDQLLKVGYPPDEANHMIGSYYAVRVIQAEIQAAIMAFGPVVLSVTWYHSWFTPIGGVLPAEDYPAGGHAILAFGWDSKGLRLRNSWGTKWGNGGDCYLPWSMLNAVGEVWKAVDTIPTPAPIPPAPVTTSRTAVNITAISPVRLLDTRSGNGLSGKFSAHIPRSVQIAGRGGIPANATIVAGNLTVTNAATKGNATVGPAQTPNPTSSTIDFVSGVDLANGFTSALNTDGTLALVMGDGTTADFVIDISAYFTA